LFAGLAAEVGAQSRRDRGDLEGRLMRHALLVAVTLSGAAGLVYQVAWTRKLASVTSALTAAQAAVLAVFMTGLGLGSWLAGRNMSRVRRPLRAYALAETLAALVAVLSPWMIDGSAIVRQAAAALGLGLRFGLWLQLGVICAVLLVPTTLLGTTLPLVIEAAEARGGSRRWVGWLYGSNTLGAAVGCFVAGFVTVERWGLSASIAGGALLAAAASLVALSLPAATARPVEAVSSDDGTPARELMVLAAAMGLVGLGAEVVWTRLFALVIPNTVYAFSQVLGAVLIGIGIGGWASGWLAATEQDPRRLAGWLCGVGAIAMAAVPWLLLSFTAPEARQNALASGRSLASIAVVVAIVVVPAACVAATLPLLVHAARPSGSRGFAFLYAANTVGSVVGTVVVGFIALPWLGLGATQTALGLVAVGCALVLLHRSNAPGALVLPVVAMLACFVGHASLDLPRDAYAQRVPEGAEIVALREGSSSDVFVTREDNGRLRLWINSAWVAGTGGGHHLLGHLPALLVAEPRNAVGIALGTGQTFAALLDHGVERFHCVEIDRGVIELSAAWFAEANRGLLTDRRVVVHNDDGRAFLRSTDETFDIVALEPLQAWSAGTANLYSRDFYLDAKRVLAPGGVVAQWIPFYGQSVEETRIMVAAAVGVFPQASLWLDEHDAILVLGDRAPTLEPAVLQRRIDARGLRPTLAKNQAAEARDLVALLLAGPEGLARWTKGAEVLDDDHPFLEFRAARAWGEGTQTVPLLEQLLPHLQPLPGDTLLARQAEVIRRAALREALAGGESLPWRAQWLEKAIRAAPGSALLQKLYGNVMLEWASTARSPQDEAVLYERALEVEPGLGRAAFNLAIVYLQLGRPADAHPLLLRAKALGALPPQALPLIDKTAAAP
jgi:spermidine synthase